MGHTELTDANITAILTRFALPSPPERWEPFGSGHINHTWRVTCRDGMRYILQRISDTLTDQPGRMMENIVRVTDHLRKTEKDPRKVLTPVRTTDGSAWVAADSGSWRMYIYIEDSVCLQTAETDRELFLAASAFGHFEQQLKDFPADQLFEPLPDFHNTPVRYRQLHAAMAENPAGRLSSVPEELAFVLEREEEMGTLVRLAAAGELPVRVTHNDTKLNNVLFDRETGDPLCVIDLDTVMPGLSLYDFGDMVRYGAATAAEDEKDLSKVHLDLHRYRVFRDGFLSACPDLTPLERQLLPMGAKVITAEQAVRFLTDYLNGDRYYRISYPEQNLDRTRTQIRLVQDMEGMWDSMRE